MELDTPMCLMGCSPIQGMCVVLVLSLVSHGFNHVSTGMCIDLVWPLCLGSFGET